MCWEAGHAKLLVVADIYGSLTIETVYDIFFDTPLLIWSGPAAFLLLGLSSARAPVQRGVGCCSWFGP